MTATLYTAGGGPVNRDIDVIRATNEIVNNDAPPAIETQEPGYNDARQYQYEAGGLSPNAMAPYTVPSSKAPPIVTTANTDYAARINNQVSTSGTAAEREASGQWGHGTLHIQQALEPTIVDGHQMSNLYFAANRQAIQGHSGTDISANVGDTATQAMVLQKARSKAAKAVVAGAYQAFIDGVV